MCVNSIWGRRENLMEKSKRINYENELRKWGLNVAKEFLVCIPESLGKSIIALALKYSCLLIQTLVKTQEIRDKVYACYS